MSRIDPMCLADYAVSKMPGPSHQELGVKGGIRDVRGAFEQAVPSSDCRCRRLSGEETADSAYVPDLAPGYSPFHSVAVHRSLQR